MSLPSDLKPALEFVAGQATDVAKGVAELKVIRDWPDPRKFATFCNGIATLHDRPLPGRSLFLMESLADLVAIAIRHKAQSIWHDHDHVVAVFDELEQCRADRRSEARLNLHKADLFTIVEHWRNGCRYSQEELIKLCKRKLRGAINVELLAAVRTVKFRKSQQTGSTINHGDHSLGAEVEAQVVNAQDIPEAFTVDTQVYANVIQDFTTTIDCDLDIDLQLNCFELATVGDELDGAIDAAQAVLRQQIVTLLEEESIGIPVYKGSPVNAGLLEEDE